MSSEARSRKAGQKITTFLWFDKNAEEAMNFYVDIFNNAPHSRNNSKIITIKRYPQGPLQPPIEGMEGQVLTGVFELDGQQYMALDGGPAFKPNESISLLVDCQDQEEIDYFWDTFTKDGGEESECGWLKDKYGFSWQITPSMEKFLSETDPEKEKRSMDAMLKMKKIIIADLENA